MRSQAAQTGAAGGEEITAARLWLVLARASASVGTFIERSMGLKGFCLTDFMILEALLHKGPMTISAIGEKVLLASASMTSAIDRLEERNLVHRSLSAEDRRVRLVDLTCDGRRFIEELFAQHVDDLESISTGISQEERKVLYVALKKIGFAAQAATPPLPGHGGKVA
ncbi:MarR family winged helix-turn-helix transcriptional regulator [Granulicella aggregans]|uniref:MarR family winged helix-turn-helix transcriptional regulator n=1 Tax=Granulicella aggregans TaxID=474949 RepID=UPI0021E0E67A|nr:MarR family transcriptional regulator [Granulicella aggregans]